MIKFEVDRILKRKRVFVHPDIVTKIKSWKEFDYRPFPEDIAMVWNYIKENPTTKHSMRHISSIIELKDEYVTAATRELEARGWLEINRKVKPYVYKIVEPR